MKFLLLSLLSLWLVKIIGDIFSPIKVGKSKGLSVNGKTGKSYLTEKDVYM